MRIIKVARRGLKNEFNAAVQLNVFQFHKKIEHFERSFEIECATLENESSSREWKRRGNEKDVVIAFERMIFKVRKNIATFT